MPAALSRKQMALNGLCFDTIYSGLERGKGLKSSFYVSKKRFFFSQDRNWRNPASKICFRARSLPSAWFRRRLPFLLHRSRAWSDRKDPGNSEGRAGSGDRSPAWKSTNVGQFKSVCCVQSFISFSVVFLICLSFFCTIDCWFGSVRGIKEWERHQR